MSGKADECATGGQEHDLGPISERYARTTVLSFGVTVLPDPPYTRLVDVLQRGEELGFEYGWTYDSHILWQESYALLAIAGAQTMHCSAAGSRPASSAARRAVSMIHWMICGSASWMITPSPTRPATPSALGP